MTGFDSKRDAAADKLQEPVVKVVSTAPKHIWLDIGFNPQNEAEVAFHELYDVTWSEDNASGYGIEYVRADITPPQPAQEPVAWVCHGVDGNNDIDFEQHEVDAIPVGTMLYTTPPQREPLTDEAVLDIADYYLYNGGKSYGILKFARAIETAHGIKEKNT